MLGHVAQALAGRGNHVVAEGLERVAPGIEVTARAARGLGIPADAASDIGAAFDAVAVLDLSPPPPILVTGSLYLDTYATAVPAYGVPAASEVTSIGYSYTIAAAAG